MIHSTYKCGLLLFTVFILAGCGGSSDGPEMHAVSGAVTFDGTPIDEGRILFRSAGGTGTAYSAEIKEGKFNMETVAGKMSVEIVASREVPGKFSEPASPDEEPTPLAEMYVPKQYNAETTLTADVTESGENEFTFDLKSQ